MDARKDRESLSTCPPLEYRIGTRPERIGAASNSSQKGDIGYMEIPPQSGDNMAVEMQIRQLAEKLPESYKQADAVEQT